MPDRHSLEACIIRTIKIMDLLLPYALGNLKVSGDNNTDGQEQRVDANTTNIVAVTAVFLMILIIGASTKGKGSRKTSMAQMSRKQLKDLIASAKEPQDHRKLAEYYRQEARLAQLRANERKEMQELYSKLVAGSEWTSHLATHGVPHYQHWADLGVEEAKAPEALACLHEDLARAEELK
jgi:hypothetical protein